MKKLLLEDIAKLIEAPENLYLEKGQLIFERGAPVPVNAIDILDRAGVLHLCQVTDEELEEFRFNAEYKPIDLENRDLFQEEGKLQRSLYNREGRLILGSGSVWTMRIVENLKRKNETVLYLRRPKTSMKRDEESATELRRRLLASVVKTPEKEIVGGINAQFNEIDSSFFNPDLIDNLASKFNDSLLPDTDNALIKSLPTRDVTKIRTDREKLHVVNFHDRSFADLKNVLMSISMKHITESSGLVDIARNLIEILVRDKELLLNSVFLKKDFDQNFVISHTIKSTVVAVNIALAMEFSSQQIFELALGSLLHDIGMLRVPQEILHKKTQLTDMEKSEIFRHPIYALDILEKIRNIPVTTPLVAYHCHERGDRSGYPKGRTMITINLYARVIAIADVYCAMISKRSYRDAFTPYSVMEYLTREAVSGRIDSKIFKAFLKINSLYSLGSWVALTDGRVGKVIAADPEQYDRPVVRIFFVDNKRVDNGEALVLVDHPEIKVAKAFSGSKLKIDAMEGF